MKNYRIAVIVLMVLITQFSYGQVTVDDNLPFGNRFVGFDNSSNIVLPIENRGFDEIDISSNGNSKFAITEQATWNGLNGLTKSDVQRTTMGLQGEDDQAWSILHLRSDSPNSLTQLMRRDWMNVGVSHTANRDFLYSGLLERPESGGNDNQTDAVLAWGCQDAPATADNFRFLFLEPDATGLNQGTEMMRITPWGNVGMGSIFNNGQQPQNRLEIHNDNGQPQLRISEAYNSIFTEMETSPAGNLHILPQGGDGPNAVAIGFLPGQLGQDPQSPIGVPTILDVGGLTRIRNLPSQGQNSCLVIGSTAAGGAGQQDAYLKRLNFTGNSDEYLSGDGTWIDISTSSDLDWETDGTDVWTGHGLNGFPAGDVFIGSTPGINARLSISDVANSASRSGQQIAVDRVGGSGTTRGLNVILADLQDAGFNAGVDARVRGGKFAVGGRFITDIFNNQSEWSAGVAGYCEGTIDGPVDVIGVYGYAENNTTVTSTRPIGVYGEAIFAGSTPTSSIAGHFQGLVQQLLPPIVLSDETLKQNIEEIENADDILSILNPVRYNYDMVDDFGINAGENTSHGFLAQELQSSFPEAVTDFYVPERRDTAGVVTRERSMHLGVKYNEFIALLVKGHQEQNALLDSQATMLTQQEEVNEELEAQVAALSEQLEAQAAQMTEMQNQMSQVMSSFQSTQSKMNNCCGTAPSEKSHSESGKNELEQNFPNPFETETTINFTLAESAQIRLEISDTKGRVLEVLVNENLSAGRYTERWDASAYAPGTYYYSLYADTELLSKKMIKK